MKKKIQWVSPLIVAFLLSATAAILLPVSAAFAQALPKEPAPENWFNLDMEQDSVLGVSTEKAYQQLLDTMQADTVIVAVIDGGVEVDHEDLLGRIWVNPDERKGNRRDDDRNGYTDDMFGWDFIGGRSGQDVHYDNLEVTRLLRKLAPRYEHADSTRLSKEQLAEYRRYRSLKDIVDTEVRKAKDGFDNYNSFYQALEIFAKKVGKEEISREDIADYQPLGEYDQTVKNVVLQNLDETGLSFPDFLKNVKEGVDYFGAKVKYHYNLDFDPRYKVQDNYNDPFQRFYGNNEVEGPDGRHGTHVAGIIAADRENNKGIKGIAAPAKIMAIRTVPDGDERDKDVANAILYAADNGAKVINMSFGKSYSPQKEAVDEAVKYALSKDVLFVHAAGNDSENIDAKPNYPSPYFEDSTRAGAWIEVGASTWMGGNKLAAEFSNYGAKRVDLFAPGFRIRSTVPGSAYEDLDGTSMASPVVAGVAALIRAYYPSLSAGQVKEALVSSVTPVTWNVIKPGTENEQVKMTELCASGGVVNAYEALLAAKEILARAQTEQTGEAPAREKSGIAKFFQRLFGKKEK